MWKSLGHFEQRKASVARPKQCWKRLEIAIFFYFLLVWSYLVHSMICWARSFTLIACFEACCLASVESSRLSQKVRKVQLDGCENSQKSIVDILTRHISGIACSQKHMSNINCEASVISTWWDLSMLYRFTSYYGWLQLLNMTGKVVVFSTRIMKLMCMQRATSGFSQARWL